VKIGVVIPWRSSKMRILIKDYVAKWYDNKPE